MHPAGDRKDRGREVTRIEAFVDAAFAFAVTLLVISFNALPDSADDLRGALAAQWMIPATGALALLFLAVTALLGKPSLAGMSGFAYALMALTGVAVARARRRAERGEDATT